MQCPVDIADSIVIAAQATRHTRVGAHIDRSLRVPAVTETPSKYAFSFTVHKPGVAHSVAVAKCQAGVKPAEIVGRHSQGCRTDGQGPSNKADVVVIAAQPARHNRVAARIDLPLRSAAVSQSAAQRTGTIPIDKTVIGHSVAAAKCQAGVN